jgi:hypothetical protein
MAFKVNDVEITSILNAGFKTGRDSENLIDFATTDNKLIFRVNNVNEVEIVANVLQPTTNDGAALGTASLMWSDLFLADGSVINFNNGDMTLTHSSNTLTVAGGTFATAALTATTINGVGTATIDGDLTFTGAQSITTSAGNLTITPAGGQTIIQAARTNNMLALTNTTDSQTMLFYADTATTFSWYYGAAAVTVDSSQNVRIPNGNFFIGDTANGKMTQGLTINQAAAANEILTFKSSGVDHAMTTPVENDTYGAFRKLVADGGLVIQGYGEGGNDTSLFISAITGDATPDTTTGTGAYGVMRVNSAKTDGSTGITALAATENIITIDNNGTTGWILKGNGDTWQSGTLEANNITIGGVQVAAAVYTLFTSSGTWTKAAGITTVIVECYGAGGGGGGGEGASAGTIRDAGAGGGGGSRTRVVYNAADLGATETITIGAGGTSGAGGGTPGTDGGLGGNSTFGSTQTGFGGGGGNSTTGNERIGGTGAGTAEAGNTPASSPGIGGRPYTDNQDINYVTGGQGGGCHSGGNGGNSEWGGGGGGGLPGSATDVGLNGGSSLWAGPGGGGGGGVPASNTERAGGRGGASRGVTHGGGGSLGAVNGGAGGAGDAGVDGYPGDGGGGGGGQDSGTGGAGGAGGVPSAGGGGGGAGTSTGGAGGAGGRGEIRVWEF